MKNINFPLLTKIEILMYLMAFACMLVLLLQAIRCSDCPVDPRPYGGAILFMVLAFLTGKFNDRNNNEESPTGGSEK